MIAVGEAVGKWVAQGCGVRWTEDCTAIGWLFEGKLVAGILYNEYTGASIAMHSRCDNPRHLAKQFFWAIFDYPFNQLGVRRVTGLVSTANLAAQRVDEHLGFVEEARLKDYFPDGDAIVYRMGKEDCKWLALTPRYRKEQT